MTTLTMQDKLGGFATLMWPWVARWWWTLALFAGALFSFSHFFTIAINASESLPQSVFLVLKQEREFKRGDYIAFVWVGERPYPRGLNFIKRVAGLPGDVVSHSGRHVFVNDRYIGRAREFGSRGAMRSVRLQMGPVGMIPPGHYFVTADHPDSLDSRYAQPGLVDETIVVGRAIPLF